MVNVCSYYYLQHYLPDVDTLPISNIFGKMQECSRDLRKTKLRLFLG